MRRSMGISGVLDGVNMESKCARSGSSALQKSQTLRWSVTSVSASVERVFERNESSVAEAGHAAVFRNGVVVFEAIIPSSLRVQRIKTHNSRSLPELSSSFS